MRDSERCTVPSGVVVQGHDSELRLWIDSHGHASRLRVGCSFQIHILSPDPDCLFRVLSRFILCFKLVLTQACLRVYQLSVVLEKHMPNESTTLGTKILVRVVTDGR